MHDVWKTNAVNERQLLQMWLSTSLDFFSSAGARDRVIAVANVGDKCESCTL